MPLPIPFTASVLEKYEILRKRDCLKGYKPRGKKGAEAFFIWKELDAALLQIFQEQLPRFLGEEKYYRLPDTYSHSNPRKIGEEKERTLWAFRLCEEPYKGHKTTLELVVHTEDGFYPHCEKEIRRPEVARVEIKGFVSLVGEDVKWSKEDPNLQILIDSLLSEEGITLSEEERKVQNRGYDLLPRGICVQISNPTVERMQGALEYAHNLNKFLYVYNEQISAIIDKLRDVRDYLREKDGLKEYYKRLQERFSRTKHKYLPNVPPIPTLDKVNGYIDQKAQELVAEANKELAGLREQKIDFKGLMGYVQ